MGVGCTKCAYTAYISLLTQLRIKIHSLISWHLFSQADWQKSDPIMTAGSLGFPLSIFSLLIFPYPPGPTDLPWMCLFVRESQMQSFCPKGTQLHWVWCPTRKRAQQDQLSLITSSSPPPPPPLLEAKGTDLECRSAFPLPEKTIKAEDKTFAKVPFADSWFNIFIGHCMNNWEKVLKLFSSSYLI